MASSAYPDCFKENEYGVSGSIDSCPECGSTDYDTEVKERSGLADLKCRSCGQNYSVSKSLVSS